MLSMLLLRRPWAGTRRTAAGKTDAQSRRCAVDAATRGSRRNWRLVNEVGDEVGAATGMNEVSVDIAPGDTLSEIAARYDVSVEELQRLNGIEDPDLLHAGQTIVVHTATNAPTPDILPDDSSVSIIAVVFLALLLILFRRRRRTGTRARRPAPPRASKPPEPVRHLAGKAYVTDGDGIRVSGKEVRFAGLDAPEWNQPAKHRDGYWFAHGKRVKSALIREIGGKPVQVVVEEYDKFGRAVGTVTCDGRDIGEWLVREGHAKALYSDRYKHIEEEAKLAKRGMWDLAVNIDPRSWRHRSRSRS